MRIIAIVKSDVYQPAIEINEADLKAYLKYAYPSANGLAWEQFVKEGVVATPTTAYYDIEHENVKEAMRQKETSND